jgi:small-conductance mechanosensitive channel
MSSFPQPIRTLAGTAALAVGLATTFACTSGRETLTEVSATPQGQALDPATNSLYEKYAPVSDAVRQQKEALTTELDEQLVLVDLKIEEVEDYYRRNSGSTEQGREQLVDRMDEERERLVAAYQTINAATNESWEEAKEQVREVIRQVSLAINELAATLEP